MKKGTREEDIKSQAERINTLFKKHKSMIGDQKATAKFKEPILILMRNNKKAEFYENATIGKFEYTHSNGEDMYIQLNRHFLQTFPYGTSEFIGYICHEDYPYPMPHDALITAEMKKIQEEKILNDYRKWTAEEWKAKGDLWWKILIGIAAILLAYALFRMLVPSTDGTVERAVTETITNNVTIMP